MKKILLVVGLLSSLVALTAQRYLSPVFNTLNVQKDVEYGQNFIIQTIPTIGHTSRQSLKCDVYTPQGDTAEKRPLVIFLHGGRFFPKNIIGSPIGDKVDSSAVEICSRLSKMGYVAVSATYRLGWYITASYQDDRSYSLINSIYRGVQDVNTCIRYFKKNAFLYGIDTSRVVVWGEEAGSYIALSAATLTSTSKLIATKYPQGKFIYQGNPTFPMLDESINGDIEAKKTTITPTRILQYLPPNDTICLANAVDDTTRFTSNFHLCVNMSGAIPDLSWIDRQTMPIISFHCPPSNPTYISPYKEGLLDACTIGRVSCGWPLHIFNVQGSFLINQRADSMGTNAVFSKITPQYDPYQNILKARTDGNLIQGLFPFYSDVIFPFQFWSLSDTFSSRELSVNPNMSAAKARRYIDSFITYFAPRACLALNLGCKNIVLGLNDVKTETIPLTISPNPTTDKVLFESTIQEPIQSIALYNIDGQLVFSQQNINSSQYTLFKSNCPKVCLSLKLLLKKAF